MAEEDKPMGIWDHLTELRGRLFKALIALVITTLISFATADRFVEILAMPVGGTEALISIEVTENVQTFMRVALLSGFILALPIILYELLSFILPGLTRSEKRWVYISIPLATLLFVAGVVFAYFVMLPTALPFLISFMGIKTTPRLINYFNFVTNLLFWIGVSFETPLFVFLLAKLRFISARTLAKQWRIAIVVIALLSAVITPTPDPVNMGLLMLPLFALYLMSIGFAWVARRGEELPEKTRAL
jgi:sec-independent protein translocase protein TatC